MRTDAANRTETRISPRRSAAVTFGTWLRERRERQGFSTQAQLADRMSSIGPEVVAPNYIWSMENDRVKVPQQPYLRQLAEAIDVSEVDILRAAGLIQEPEERTVAYLQVKTSPQPFPEDDPRSRIVDMLREFDPSDPIDMGYLRVLPPTMNALIVEKRELRRRQAGLEKTD